MSIPILLSILCYSKITILFTKPMKYVGSVQWIDLMPLIPQKWNISLIFPIWNQDHLIREQHCERREKHCFFISRLYIMERKWSDFGKQTRGQSWHIHNNIEGNMICKQFFVVTWKFCTSTAQQFRINRESKFYDSYCISY